VSDRIESAGTEFHARVEKAYRLLSTTESGIERIDGGAQAEVVHAEIVHRLSLRFPETFAPGKVTK
jgi:thymidylate kinase